MRILSIGTWDPEKSKEYRLQAHELGKILAERGHIMVASPSSGIQGMVAKSYKENGGKEYIGYYPKLEDMEEVGEEVLVEPDTKIHTEEDYPVRNLIQTRNSDGVIALTGGSGTLTELIAAVKDYDLPVSYYEGSSEVVDEFLKIDEDLSKKVNCEDEVADLVDYLENKST